MGMLCDFMDYLCGAMLIAKRLKSRVHLHDITLPKSWIVRLVRDLEKLSSQDTQLEIEYDKYFYVLLEQIFSGVDAGTLSSARYQQKGLSDSTIYLDHLLTGRGRGNLGEIGKFMITRNIYFARMYVAVGALKVNFI